VSQLLHSTASPSVSEVVPVSNRRIGGSEIQTVDARLLHALLEVGKDFSTWIKDRIEQYGFVENHDFLAAQELSSPKSGSSMARPQRTIAYYLSLDMAKELAMVERNAKGRQARQYFIECERRAKANVVNLHQVIDDPSALRQVLLGYTERVIKLESQLEAAQPKVDFHDKVCEAVNAQSIEEVAKVLSTGRNRLFRWLRERGLLQKSNIPYQEYIDRGYFRVIERQYVDGRGESHTYTRTLVTGRGLSYIQRHLAEAVAA